MLQIPSPFGTTDAWAQFGLAGLVIFALFGCLYLIGNALISRMNTTETERQQFIQKMMEQHRTERQEWRSDFEKSREAHTVALEKLTTATVDALHEVKDELTALRTLQEVQLRGS